MPGPARMALGDAQPGPGLEQRLAHIATDEAAAAENGDEWRIAGGSHGMLDPSRLNRCRPWAKRNGHARAARQAVDRIRRRPLSAAAYLQMTTYVPRWRNW